MSEHEEIYWICCDYAGVENCGWLFSSSFLAAGYPYDVQRHKPVSEITCCLLHKTPIEEAVVFMKFEETVFDLGWQT